MYSHELDISFFLFCKCRAQSCCFGWGTLPILTKLLLGPTLPLFPAHGDVQNNHRLRSISRQQEEKLQSGSGENAPTFLRFLFQRSTDRLTVLFAKTGKASKSQPARPSKNKENTQENHIFPHCGAGDPCKQRGPRRCVLLSTVCCERLLPMRHSPTSVRGPRFQSASTALGCVSKDNMLFIRRKIQVR